MSGVPDTSVLIREALVVHFKSQLMTLSIEDLLARLSISHFAEGHVVPELVRRLFAGVASSAQALQSLAAWWMRFESFLWSWVMRNYCNGVLMK
jgi:hypothetical protein